MPLFETLVKYYISLFKLIIFYLLIFFFFIIKRKLLRNIIPQKLKTLMSQIFWDKIPQKYFTNSKTYKGGSKFSINQRSHTIFTFNQISPYALNIDKSSTNTNKTKYLFVNYSSITNIPTDFVACKLPAYSLISLLSKDILYKFALSHNIKVVKRESIKDIKQKLYKHYCLKCTETVLLFKPIIKLKKSNIKIDNITFEFPPKPSSNKLVENIINDWYNDLKTDNIIEEGCTICGELTLKKHLTLYNLCNFDKSLIIPSKYGLNNISRLERNSIHCPITELKGELRDYSCNGVCFNCLSSLSKNKLPINTLANSLWLGKIPEQLQDLSYAEKLLIARVRHN